MKEIRKYELGKDKELIGIVKQEVPIKLQIEDKNVEVGIAYSLTRQVFNKLGTEQFPKFVKMSKDRIEKQLQQINDALDNMSGISEEALHDVNIPTLIQLRKSEFKRQLVNLDAYIGKLQKKQQLITQKDYLESQLKMVNEDEKLLSEILE